MDVHTEVHIEDPGLERFLRCVRELATGDRLAPEVTPPEPRGRNVCCRCGRKVRHLSRSTAWVRLGEWAWCYDCKDYRVSRAEAEAVRKLLQGPGP